METIAPNETDAEIQRTMGLALSAGRHAEVLEQAAIALARAPDDVDAHFARGTALNALHRPATARAALTRAVVLCPSFAAGWLNLGNACADLNELTEAERHYRTAIRFDPRLSEAWTSLGHLLLGQGRLDDAIVACETATRISPTMAEAHWNLASALLTRGDLPRGFRAYEWRKRHPAFRADLPPMPGPGWDGGDPAGKVILVRAEQGFGDTIQCARFLKLIVLRGATPVVSCDSRLVPLLASMPGVVALPRTARMEGYDAWIDLMSLPLAFGTELATIPLANGYLRDDPARTALWRTRLSGGPRIGIAWAGNPVQANDARRSIPAAMLATLLDSPSVSFVNLQFGERAGEIGLPNLSSNLGHFGETAALVANLDLVISVDSAVAHLAGAMGVPVWVLLAHVPDWRWLLHREDSPWYASARLFRQAAPGDWGEVVQRVAAALRTAFRSDAAHTSGSKS